MITVFLVSLYFAAICLHKSAPAFDIQVSFLYLRAFESAFWDQHRRGLIVLLDRMGYILSETFMLLVVISSTKAILRLRRGRGRRRFLGRHDRQEFFQPIRSTASAPVRYFRYAVICTSVLTIGTVEIIILSPFGAAIIAGALLVTCTTIVRCGLAAT